MELVPGEYSLFYGPSSRKRDLREIKFTLGENKK
jgi:hypothetical protein